MEEAVSRIRELILRKNPQAGSSSSHGVIPVAIRINGTWHKREYSPKYNVVLGILVETGEIID